MGLIGPPIIQLMVFGYAASFDLEHIPYAVFNQDSGDAARELLAGFSGSPTFEQVATLTHQARIAPLIDNRDALLTLVVTLLVTGLSVAREREMGTFDQLLVTPLRPFEILLGKAIPGFIIGVVEAGFIMLMAVFWFQVPFVGRLLALLLGLFLFLLAAIGIGLMIASLAVTQQQGLLGVFLFLVPAIILSGFATPIANMPEAVQAITYLNPMRYFLIIVRGVFLEGSTISMLIPQYWPLALIGLISMGASGWLFRHRMG